MSVGVAALARACNEGVQFLSWAARRVRLQQDVPQGGSFHRSPSRPLRCNATHEVEKPPFCPRARRVTTEQVTPKDRKERSHVSPTRPAEERRAPRHERSSRGRNQGAVGRCRGSGHLEPSGSGWRVRTPNASERPGRPVLVGWRDQKRRFRARGRAGARSKESPAGLPVSLDRLGRRLSRKFPLALDPGERPGCDASAGRAGGRRSRLPQRARADPMAARQLQFHHAANRHRQRRHLDGHCRLGAQHPDQLACLRSCSPDRRRVALSGGGCSCSIRRLAC